MRFLPISPKDLEQLGFTLSLLDKLSVSSDDFQLYLYGISSNAVLRKAAAICIASESDEENPSPAFTGKDIALAIVLDTERLQQLHAEGIALTEESEFCYLRPGEGPRTSTFWGITYPKRYQMPKVKLSDFTHLALCNNDLYLDEFMQKFGTAPVVTRGTATDGVDAPIGEVIAPERKTTPPRSTTPPVLEGEAAAL